MMTKAGQRRARWQVLAARRVGVTLGLAAWLLSGAAVAPAGLSPAALAAGHPAGWSIVPSPNGAPADNALAQVSAISATDAWAVGSDNGPGAFHTLIQHWNGSRWGIVPSPNPSQLDNVLAGVDALSAASAWAVGYDTVNVYPHIYHRALIEHWNGSTWQVVPTPQAGSRDSDLWAVAALSAANAWAVGNENTAFFRFRPLVEHWNGASWTLVPVPSPPLIGVGASLGGIAATSPRNIWAVGNYYTGTRFQPLIEHWNGARWALIPDPVPGSAGLSQISFQAPGNGWAVGTSGAGPASQALIEHWNGHHWAIARSPVIPGSNLNGVLALSQRLTWAVGTFPPRHGGTGTLIERWNGRAWAVTPSPNRPPTSGLLGIAGTQRHLWAVGYSLTSTLILRYPGLP